MRTFASTCASLAVVMMALGACSSDSGGDRPDAGRRAAGSKAPSKTSSTEDPPDRPASGGVHYRGTLRGETEVPDGGLPDGGVAWHGEGTLQLDVRGEEVEGRVEAAGMTLVAKGNFASGSLRAWLRAPAGQPRTEGVLLGDQQGERLTGTWRVSGPGGEEIRAGSFEAGH